MIYITKNDLFSNPHNLARGFTSERLFILLGILTWLLLYKIIPWIELSFITVTAYFLLGGFSVAWNEDSSKSCLLSCGWPFTNQIDNDKEY